MPASKRFMLRRPEIAASMFDHAFDVGPVFHGR